jgi:hypothetical protein
MQFAAALALLAATTGLFSLWSGMFDSKVSAGLSFGGLALFIAFLYDRRQARLARTEHREMTKLDR